MVKGISNNYILGGLALRHLYSNGEAKRPRFAFSYHFPTTLFVMG